MSISHQGNGSHPLPQNQADCIEVSENTAFVADLNTRRSLFVEDIYLAAKPNEAPIANDDFRRVKSSAFDRNGITYTGNVLINDVDPDGGKLRIIAVNGDPNLVGANRKIISGDTHKWTFLQLNADGSYRLRVGPVVGPPIGKTSARALQYTVEDEHGARDTAILRLYFSKN